MFGLCVSYLSSLKLLTGFDSKFSSQALLEDLGAGKFQLLFSSAENVLEKEFLAILKQETIFHRSLAAVVDDKSHTVETWSGRSSIDDESHTVETWSGKNSIDDLSEQEPQL